jgi:hypothetical protein
MEHDGLGAGLGYIGKAIGGHMAIIPHILAIGNNATQPAHGAPHMILDHKLDFNRKMENGKWKMENGKWKI